MTPKEKALQLVNKYNLIVLDTALGGSNQRVKQCALIAVDEIINQYYTHTDNVTQHEYWEQVKQEINKL